MIKVICIKSIDGFIKGNIYEAEVATTLNRNIDIDMILESLDKLLEKEPEELFITAFSFNNKKKLYYTDNFIPLAEWRDNKIDEILMD